MARNGWNLYQMGIRATVLPTRVPFAEPSADVGHISREATVK